MSHTISKEFSICYGHRVWTQLLDGRYSNDLTCACRHLHGHEGTIHVHLTAPELRNGMITDFRHTEILKKWLNTHIDHHFIIDHNDPLFGFIVPQDIPLRNVTVRCNANDRDMVCGNVLDTRAMLQGSHKEYADSFFIVPFTPTSENLSKWFAEIVQFVMDPLGVTVSQLDWYETPRSKSTYRPGV